MNTALIVTMGSVAIVTAVSEKVCVAFGKADIAGWVNIAGMSLVGASAVGLAINLLKTVSTLF